MELFCPPSGILQLAAIIEKQDQHKVRVVLAAEYPEYRTNLERELKDCDVLGISSTSYNWYVARELIATAKEIKPEIIIVLGGVHPSHLPEYCLTSTDADIVVCGEAEISFPLLLDHLSKKKTIESIAGIVYKDEKGDIVATPERPLLTVQEITNLPVPAYHLIPPGHYGYTPIEGSRGCKFDCAFCGILYRNNFRALPAERIEAVARELTKLEDRFTEKALFFTDDSFGTNKSHTCDQLDALSKTGYKLGMEIRFQDLLDPSISSSMSKNEFYLVQIGVEAGYQQASEKIDKKISFESVYRFADDVARHNYARSIRFSMVMGLPWEHEDHVLSTINAGFELAVRAGSPPPMLNNFNPLPGSRFIHNSKEFSMPALGPEFWDDGNWFRPYLGFTNIPQANKDYLAWYSGSRHQIHPYLPDAPFLIFPDGSFRPNLVWGTETNTFEHVS